MLSIGLVSVVLFETMARYRSKKRRGSGGYDTHTPPSEECNWGYFVPPEWTCKWENPVDCQ